MKNENWKWHRLHSVWLILPLLASGANASAELTSSQACAQIDQAYSSCGRRYKYTPPLFQFPVGREQVAVQCSDGRDVPFYDRLEDMDVSSMLMIPYQNGQVALPETRKNWDPGRLRTEPLLKSVYGFNEGSVRQNLVPVKFLNQTILFQQKLGAAAAASRWPRLGRIGEERCQRCKFPRSVPGKEKRYSPRWIYLALREGNNAPVDSFVWNRY